MRNARPAAIAVTEEVETALREGRPLVALESTLVTHGFAPPRNLEAAQRAEQAIRARGAVPATIAIADGRLLVGVSADQLERLAAAGRPLKASRHNLAAVLARGGLAGTTVSATMIAAAHVGIRLFATGGIGGVHRGAATTFDISADLEELARTPVAVVCSGPKSILDIDLTLEYLETRGVPVVGYGTDELAGFTARSSGRPAPSRVDSATQAASLLDHHWGLGLGGGVVIAAPIPDADALSNQEARAVTHQALEEAEAHGIRGPASTPWLLDRIAHLTDGRSVHANLSLIENNAAVAADIARALVTIRA